MSNHHDTGYKELFSYPELVRQLIEGFAPPEVATMMDFATLTDHSGSYITPLFGEKFEDKVWSVEVKWNNRKRTGTLDPFTQLSTQREGQALLTLLLSYPSAIRRLPPRQTALFHFYLKTPGPKTTVSA
ncbi:hypothetical protein M911_13950 [Ectothiorhodospira haloalkaliphila]|uniref:Transposase (putative) YhgA-like domain-containing protein n=1 Tax=Ectothiorhodospira haloalkaliphila TaxID=421628 RepID=W8KSS5_9GAMM|nr:Rpn family recombination-promoting nuclease/putative transposase [Ectothiorhodospira haloalkaliphila]AHK80072.1 hypothetical protein M911_13950 [Ectothiorhodospira haloalkaliphila]